MRKKKRKLKKGFKICATLFIVGISLGLFLLYGPYAGFRNFWITTAMTTMNHQYLATLLYSDKTINKVLENNKVIEPNHQSNTDLIDINDKVSNNVVYKDKYEKEILEHEKGESYKVIKFRENGYDAYLAAIYDSTKVKVVTSKNIGKDGQYLVDMSKENNALIAINGGGFQDPNGQGNGGKPIGIVIKDGEIINNTASNTNGGVIGLTKDGKLYLANTTAEKAIEDGVRDAIEFGPFLIVNGVKANIKGNGGMGIHPRSAIGQRKDGVMLFLVIDGRRTTSLGASIKDVMDIMERYGAYNAANLDGGNSAVLVVDHKIINRPINWDNLEVTRKIATGFVLTK